MEYKKINPIIAFDDFVASLAVFFRPSLLLSYQGLDEYSVLLHFRCKHLTRPAHRCYNGFTHR